MRKLFVHFNEVFMYSLDMPILAGSQLGGFVQ